jgi:hypothetical protein
VCVRAVDGVEGSTDGHELGSAGLCFPLILSDETDVGASCLGSAQGISDRETAQLSGAR